MKAEPAAALVELERFYEADEVELRGGGGRKRLRDVPAIEGPAEAHLGRALSVRKRMLATTEQARDA